MWLKAVRSDNARKSIDVLKKYNRAQLQADKSMQELSTPQKKERGDAMKRRKMLQDFDTKDDNDVTNYGG